MSEISFAAKFHGRVVLSWLALWLGLLLSIPTAANVQTIQDTRPELHFAVLAFRPTPEMIARWQSVARYLDEKIPSHRIILEALDYPELEQVVRQKKVDLVLTQPAHYVALSVEQNLYSPLATLVEAANGLALTEFGGVIFVRADQSTIQNLADIYDKRIATSHRESLGAYQAQAFELHELGISLGGAQVIETGKQDGVIAALNEDKADVGFVRSGLLEQMASEGKIKLSDFRVLKSANVPHYPLLLSTRLYPQWALAAMPWLDKTIARQVAGAILSLPHDGEVAKTAGISGFNIPGDYRSVDRLMRALRVPPFEARVPIQIILEDHPYLVIAIALIFLSGVLWIFIASKRSSRQRRLNLIDLQASERRFYDFADAASDWFWEMGPDLRFTYFSERISETLGTSPVQMIGKTRQDIMNPDDISEKWEAHFNDMDQRRAFKEFDYLLALPDGTCRYISISGKPVFDDAGAFAGYRGIGHDITERKQAEEQLRQAAIVFQHASEGIVITDTHGNILEVNTAFSTITGYDREEVLGKNTALLSSGRQGKGFYALMWQKLAESGQWSGEIWNRRKSGEVYAEMLTINTVRNPQGEPLLYVGLFHDITVLKEQQHQLEHMAHYDALTQLPNRVLLADRLQQALNQAERRSNQIAVVYLDLDGFKSVNDMYGHASGDKLLVELSKQMKRALRDGDTLSRLGGDEFVIVLLDLDDHAASAPILERLLKLTSCAINIDGQSLQVSASLGVTFFPQSDEIGADQLMRQADQAMYIAKQLGKNRYHIFDADQDRAVRGRHESIERIRDALDNHEFVLYYQPKVNMRTGKVIGAEALIRWQHPEQGILAPSCFLPLVEEHELIKPIGDWVIETALRQMEEWQAQGLTLPVSVNVAGRQLQSPDFVGKLRVALYQHPGVANDLTLEVLESSALEDISQVSQLIADCKKMGVSFDLDDFGTGYSSLTYLKRLPAQTLKIDQSFVRDMLEDPDDLAILDGIIGLATSFQRDIIAEGVESHAHSMALLRLGCELGQGYAIAKPMPANEMLTWVANWHPVIASIPRQIKRDELPVLFAMTEHRAWLKALELQLLEQQSVMPLLNHHQCRFGHWLDHSGAKKYIDHPALPQILSIHEEIHCLANDLLELKQRGLHDEAYRNYSTLEIASLRDRLLILLESLLD